MNPSDFLLARILAVYVGFSRLNHLQYLEPELCTPCDPAGLIRVRAMAKGTSASPPTLG
jgi:hypothetical protein